MTHNPLLGTAKTFTATIYVGMLDTKTKNVNSDLEPARNLLKEYCNKVGLCVTLTPTEFIYVDGNEPGFYVGLINYPRFPSSPETIGYHATQIAHQLMKLYNQDRVSVVCSENTWTLQNVDRMSE